ncbi:MAG: hypothetical protein V1800_07100 [Candidatus Latescibacterota bacterium]
MAYDEQAPHEGTGTGNPCLLGPPSGPSLFIHYRPEGWFMSDGTVFYEDGCYHVFYLTKRNDDPPRLPGTSIGHATSPDLIHWQDQPLALTPGTPGSNDENGFGAVSVIRGPDRYYMFYNPMESSPVIQRAWSLDLIHWAKEPERAFLKPEKWYRDGPGCAWRDPYVFLDPIGGEYVMLVTAATRDDKGTPAFNGCIAWATSDDLENWTLKPPLYSPGLSCGLEMVGIFHEGGKYYLTICFGELFNVSYRVADRLEGPYRRTAQDVLCQGFHYGAREFSDGEHHYLLPGAWEREAKNDAPGDLWYSGGYIYGGASATVQELKSLPDGSLEVHYPSLLDQVRGAAIGGAPTFAGLDTFSGNWEVATGSQDQSASLSGSSSEGAARALIDAVAGDLWLRCDLHMEGGTAAGLLLRASERGQRGYLLRLDWDKHTASLWRYPMEWVTAQPLAEVTVPGLMRGKTYEVTVLMHGNLLDAYLDGHHLFSRTVYDHRKGQLGFFVEDGQTLFSGLEAFALAEPWGGMCGDPTNVNR